MAKQILICSGKGGAGKSTTAVFLMRALTQKGKRVLLMDADVGLRSLDLLLGIEDGVYTWQDLLEGKAEVEDALLKTEEEPNMALLMPPRELPILPTKDRLKNMLNEVGKQFDYCLMDAPAGLYGIVPILASVADAAFVIATPDEVSARAAATLSEFFYENYPKLSQKLILNRYDYDRVKYGYSLSADTMVSKTLVQLLGAVPEAECLVARSKESKIDPKVMASYERIAERMFGNSVPFQEKRIKFVGI